MRKASTDSLRQSEFLPIFQDAETRIKAIVVLAFLYLWGEFRLRVEIQKVLNSVAKKIKGQDDRQAYLNGLAASAEKMVLLHYKRPKSYFPEIASETGMKKPIDAMKWEAKGTVRVKDYAKELKRGMAQMAGQPFVTDEPGKKPISLWQKAELDARYERNMEMISDQIAKGIDLCWLSSHPDCSKRCEKWQGKLVSLTKHATLSGFRVGKVDGHWVYSLPDIMAQVDKYGYNNNIISGFNCRHHTIPYTGQLPPKEYSEGDVRKQRSIEANIRKMERDIRKQKQYAIFLEKAGDLSGAKLQRMKADGMVSRYKAYCERNGYAWEKYRIEVRYG